MGAFSDDLLFVHIPKCAGTAVRQWLKEYVPGTTDFRDEGCNLPIGHIPLKDIERYTGRTPDSFDKIIAIVRNPYSHQLSQWLFWRDRHDRGGYHVHDQVAATHQTLTSFLHDARCDFHLWYESQVGSSDDAGAMLKRRAAHVNRYPHYGGYFKYWVTINGEAPPNLRLLRMEELDDVWLQEVGEYAVPDAPGLRVVNERTKRERDMKEVFEYYGPQAVTIVNDKFEWTFANKFYQQMFVHDRRAENVPA